MSNTNDGITTYHACIDSGECGDTEIQARDIRDAMAQAIEWARDGDWTEDGCEIEVGVWANDEDGNTVEEEERTVAIPSAQEQLDARLEDSGKAVAKRENEFSVQKIVAIDVADEGGDIEKRLYHSHDDGGPTREIYLGEARCLMLDWGYEPDEVARALRGSSSSASPQAWKVIAECEHEFSTERVVVIGGAAYYQYDNGGSGGAWDRRPCWLCRPHSFLAARGARGTASAGTACGATAPSSRRARAHRSNSGGTSISVDLSSSITGLVLSCSSAPVLCRETTPTTHERGGG